MRSSRIYVDTDLSVGISIDLPVASAHYIKNVIRMQSEQNIILFNGQDSIDYVAQIHINGKKVSATPVSGSDKKTESSLKTALFQAIGKAEHMDMMIQKATELGVSQIYLFNSQRTQTHLKAARLGKKLAHWHGIIISACEQCGRNKLPTLSFEPTIQACLELESHSNKILLDFDGKSFKALKNELNPGLMFSMLVGPEGGLTADEIQLAYAANFKSCTLGPRILRMETAALSILNIIQHHYGDMQ